VGDALLVAARHQWRHGHHVLGVIILDLMQTAELSLARFLVGNLPNVLIVDDTDLQKTGYQMEIF
jgi:hypothetical protein